MGNGFFIMKTDRYVMKETIKMEKKMENRLTITKMDR